ncbi:hypothetical protein BKH46_03070 [Helicobacter sp. 12S02634-8]|uniref:divergent polysaccharide deacetylase family protein n=1 Tax=Helicobacter sp. 12S02634-8 TaxID=1476199 RepID=UPI000BA5A9F0|nr:divergent polysaccharide deacetylase family protein [Helicobacter sp. 12S02634-8]PAF47828.1 hypothetical protein BKH46_03070 [Helicobacter sp. 12S02634-8]
MKKTFFVTLLLLVCLVLGALSGYYVYGLKPSIDTDTTTDIATDFQNNGYNNSKGFESGLSPLAQHDSPALQILQEKQEPTAQASQNPSITSITPMASIVSTTPPKPKLAIIMDDMAYPWQLESLHQLGLVITPSFFPKNHDNPHTPQMAQNEPFYMVHLPLEALHFYQSPHKWIQVGDTQAKIEAYIASIKHDFPRLHFINNHTGSKFTASYVDMKNLIEVLEKYGIHFVDSRTTPLTQAPKIYAELHTPLLSRQIFLDNKPDKKAILIQIKKAIDIAKKKGYAIAICHPHKQTFEALQIAKNTLFDSVTLVYISDIFAQAQHNTQEKAIKTTPIKHQDSQEKNQKESHR